MTYNTDIQIQLTSLLKHYRWMWVKSLHHPREVIWLSQGNWLDRNISLLIQVASPV